MVLMNDNYQNFRKFQRDDPWLCGIRSRLSNSTNMDDYDDEGQDFSKALLETVDTRTDPFLTDDIPSKRRKTGAKGPQQKDFIDDLDSFSTVTSSKSKLNGSSFKNMGTVC